MATLVLHQVVEDGQGWKRLKLCIEFPCGVFVHGELAHADPGCPARSWVQVGEGAVWRVVESTAVISKRVAQISRRSRRNDE